jgi:hypothetical protein
MVCQAERVAAFAEHALAYREAGDHGACIHHRLG